MMDYLEQVTFIGISSGTSGTVRDIISNKNEIWSEYADGENTNFLKSKNEFN